MRLTITSGYTFHCNYALVFSFMSQHWPVNTVTDSINTTNLNMETVI